MVRRAPAWPDFSPFSYHLSPLRVIAVCAAITLAGCGGIATREPAQSPVARAPDGSPAPAKPPTPRGGGYYLNDGPGDNPPANIDQIPDAVPRVELLRPANMRP
jgi:rare lipoprotein A